MDKRSTENLNMVGNLRDAEVVFVCDSPGKGTWEAGDVLSNPQMNLLREACRDMGIHGSRVALLTASPPIPEEVAPSDKRTNEFLSSFQDEFRSALDSLTREARLVVAFGKTALYQIHGRPVKITKCRGTMTTVQGVGCPVLPCYSPGHVLRSPEIKDVWLSDLGQVLALKDAGWDVATFESTISRASYEWTIDLQPLLDNPPSKLAVDTETKGFRWSDGRKILIVQMSYRYGHSLIVPLDLDYFNNDTLRGETTRHLPKLRATDITRLERQLAELLGNPDVKVAGHNFKFDLHHLRNHGIEVANWAHDTMQLAFVCDDNMVSKSLDDCTRRWVSEMAGYADEFNRDPVHQDKERMDLVPHDQMSRYGGGDTDACLRLCDRLVPLAKKDSRNFRCYERIQMPGLRTFFEVERHGLRIDTCELAKLGDLLAAEEEKQYNELIREAAKRAPAVLRRHEEKGLGFGRDAFVADLLFTPDGWGLEPIMFTKTTEMLPEGQRVPSVSTKQHLPFFEHIPFVAKLIEYKKLQKLRSTYVGRSGGEDYKLLKRTKTGAVPAAVKKAFEAANLTPPAKQEVPVRRRRLNVGTPEPEEPSEIVCRVPLNGASDILVDSLDNLWRSVPRQATGFWQHLTPDDWINSSFSLSNVVTGRSSSRDPNFQNLPNRGAISQQYRKIFIPSEGYGFVECDLSQAELRIAGWMANDPVMLRAYNEGTDIHALTACRILGLTWEQFNALDKLAKKEARQKAKGTNFGFLYGMWWKSFKRYAYTQYGVKFTDRQAERTREIFFETYPALEGWHEQMKEFVRVNGFVRALHGSLRRLPGILSNDQGVRKEAERQAINSPVQRFASDLGIIAMARFMRDCPPDLAWIVAFIHDALVAEARLEEHETVARNLKFYMETNPLQEWFGITAPLPILADIKMGTESLGQMTEMEGLSALRPEWYREDLDAEFRPAADLIREVRRNSGQRAVRVRL